MAKKISVHSKKREELINITSEVKTFINEAGISNGTIAVFIPHTTAAVTINENADPDVKHDLILALNRISPDLPAFKHTEGNSDAHTKSSLIGCSLNVIVNNGDLILGTWQSIYFCEFDGPRHRTVIFQAN
ncbi:MAG: secondary thiamine-phosphate synthase enzyme YjbQ [Candidatus Cloacimonetes bacterium]|nr:secondary thiamine-phosphate synthase enzyme YjbQ [Candidatus Cloacimonadota bacterium]